MLEDTECDIGHKRKIEGRSNAAAAVSFKKARYAWQIKGSRRAFSEDGVSSKPTHLHRMDREHSRNSKIMQQSTDANMCHPNTSGVLNSNHDHPALIERSESYSCDNHPETTHLPEFCKNMHSVGPVQKDVTREHSDLMESLEAPVTKSVKHTGKARDVIDRIWRQEEEMGHAIVDNMVNKILEEMGMCPDLETNKDKPTVMAKKFLERRGVDFAIGSKGLNTRSQRLCDENDYLSGTDNEKTFSRQYCENGRPVAVQNDTHVRNSKIEQSDYNCNSYSQMSFTNLSHVPEKRNHSGRDETAFRSMDTTSDNLCSDQSHIPVVINDSLAITEPQASEYMNHESMEDLAVSAAIFTTGLAIP